MSKSLIRHPEDEQLLRYADGELPARTAAEIRSHLDGCWQCRTELQELQTVIGECVKYRQNVLEPHLPPPPAPWDDLYRRFDEIDAAARRRSVIDRVIDVLGLPLRHAKQWIPAATAIAVIVALVYQNHFAPSVEAAELLRKASAAADRKPVKGRRLQIRTKTRRFTRSARVENPVAGGVDVPASVAAMFRVAHYDWQDPLSARSYQAWRDQLSDKRDQVAKLANGYRIETTTGSSELERATLTFSAPDLIPIEGRFEFRNHEWVEISEIAAGTEPPAAIAAAPLKNAPQPARLPKPSTASSAGDELHILGALHDLGADLGDPIEVKRAGGEILVTGIGIPAERQRQIQDALGSRPNVVLRFSDATIPPLQPGDDVSRDSAPEAEQTDLRRKMEKQLGGRSYVEQLTRQVLEMSELLMSRAYALRRLAEQMPPEVESELNTKDRQLLFSLYHDHSVILARQESQIEEVLNPVLTSLGAAAPGTRSQELATATWQASTEELFQAARRMDRQVAQLLDAAPADDRSEQLPSELKSSLMDLRSKLAVCERLTAQISIRQ